MRSELIDPAVDATKNCSYLFVRGGLLILALLLAGLFVGGLIEYPGTKSIYAVFSAIFTVMLLSGLYRQVSYGYLFLAIFLWLGFWFKLTIHLLFPYPFVEFTGRFVGTAAAWDQVLVVTTVAGLGVLAARLVFLIFSERSSLVRVERLQMPQWYPAARLWLWSGLVISIIVVAIVNVIYGIHQIGLVPRTILVWPLNAGISLISVVGFTMIVATLMWWDILQGKKVSGAIYILLLEGFVSTLSLLSRGTIVFHVIPQLYALYRNKSRLSGCTKLRVLAVAMAFIGLMGLSYFSVNALRGHYYSDVPLDSAINVSSMADIMTNQAGAITSQAGAMRSQVKGTVKQVNGFVKFAVDRWIGIEGVMAVASYPEKNTDLFLRALVERSDDGKIGMYQEICLSHYRNMDVSKFRFGNLPGVVAFFYFTGDMWMVLVGMLFCTLCVLYSERWVLVLTHNPILCSFWGGAAANIVAQLGVAPRQLIPYCMVLISWVFMIRFVQSKWFEHSLQRLNFEA